MTPSCVEPPLVELCKLLKEAGATEVHGTIAVQPWLTHVSTGLIFRAVRELIAANHTVEETCQDYR